MSTSLVRKKPRGPLSNHAISSTRTIREVCLLGLDPRDRPDDWHPGSRIQWLGRDYRISDQDDRHVHVAPIDD